MKGCLPWNPIYIGNISVSWGSRDEISRPVLKPILATGAQFLILVSSRDQQASAKTYLSYRGSVPHAGFKPRSAGLC